MQQLKTPLAKQLAPRAFDIGHDFARDVESIYARDINGNELRRDLSPEGKRAEAQKASRRALRDLLDLRKPIDKFHSQTETMRAKAQLPTYDKTDFVAAMNRRELRDRSCQMTFGQRAMHMSGDTRDISFLDAVFELPAWASGIDLHDPNERQIYEEARRSRVQDVHGPLLTAIAQRDSEEEESLMVYAKVRDDIALDSGLPRKDFEEEAKRIESGIGSVWLKRSTDANGHEVIYELVPEGGGFRGQIASPDALQNGHFFQSHEEYLASRAA
jgi:hypothetical protein